MRIYILFLVCVMTCYMLQAQGNIKSIFFDFQFEHDTISIVEPIEIQVTFENKGKKALKVCTPFDVMKVSTKKEGATEWANNQIWGQNLEISEHDYKAGYNETVKYNFSYPGIEGGTYILRIEYTPNQSGRKPNKLVLEKKFVVQKYYPLSERSAIDWMLKKQNESPYFLGVIRDISTVIHGFTEEEIIELASTFINSYPKSKFVSVFYFLKAANLSKYHSFNKSLTNSIELEIRDLLLKAKETAYYPSLEFAIDEGLRNVKNISKEYQLQKN